jgi:hypothetical protein
MMESQFEDAILLRYEAEVSKEHSTFIVGSGGASLLHKCCTKAWVHWTPSEEGPKMSFFNQFVNHRNELKPKFLSQLYKHLLFSDNPKELVLLLLARQDSIFIIA